MSISEARRRANEKWRSKFPEVRFRVSKEKKEQIQEHAAQQGETLNAFLNRAVSETMERDHAKKEE